MRQSGDYNVCFTWLRRTVTKDPANGQDKETFPPNGTLWGKMLTDTAVESVSYGAIQSQSTATIRLRQWPTIAAPDRLLHKQFSDTYMITGVRRDGNDTIVEAIKYDGKGPLGEV